MRGRGLDFDKCLNVKNQRGDKAFTEAVEIRLQELLPELPLDDLCESGGIPNCWDDEPEFDLADATEHGDKLAFCGDVWLTESTATSCANINFPDERHGSIIVEINKYSGRGDVSVERAERNLEYY
jgi:hypothetical protein